MRGHPPRVEHLNKALNTYFVEVLSSSTVLEHVPKIVLMPIVATGGTARAHGKISAIEMFDLGDVPA